MCPAKPPRCKEDDGHLSGAIFSKPHGMNVRLLALPGDELIGGRQEEFIIQE